MKALRVKYKDETISLGTEHERKINKVHPDHSTAVDSASLVEPLLF